MSSHTLIHDTKVPPPSFSSDANCVSALGSTHSRLTRLGKCQMIGVLGLQESHMPKPTGGRACEDCNR